MSGTGPAGSAAPRRPKKPSSRSTAPPVDYQNVPPGFEVDAKIKTAKCRVCGERIRVFSYRCKRCANRVCSECATPTGKSFAPYKEMGRDYVENGCWCQYRHRYNEAFLDRRVEPPFRVNGKVYYPIIEDGKQVWLDKDTMHDPVPVKKSWAEINAPVNPPEPAVEPEIHEAVGDGVDGDVVDDLGGDADDENSEDNEEEIEEDMDEDEEENISYLESEVEGDTQSSRVIVGAGVIGLFIALELAKADQTNGEDLSITVIDINERPFCLASGDCAGFLSTSGMDDRWDALGEVALAAWKGLLPRIAGKIGHDKQFYHIIDKDTEKEAMALQWSHSHPGECFMYDPLAIGRIDTEALGAWLFKECKKRGVQFYFNTRPLIAHYDSSGDFEQLDTLTVKKGEQTVKRFDVADLIIAAGPYTTGLYFELFPESQILLENYNYAHQVVSLQEFGLGADDNIGILLPMFPSNDATYQNPLRMTAQPSSDTVTVSCRRQHSADVHFSPRHAVRRSGGGSTKLRDLAEEYVDHPGVDVHDRERHSQHMSFVSTANEHKPIIDCVPVSLLGASGGSGTNRPSIPSRVWLCYGFGDHGTTLAPGIARRISKMVNHETLEIDTSDFSLPELRKSLKRRGLIA